MIEINLHQNADGSLDGRYRLGDKPYTPPASADLVVDGFESYSTGNLTDPTTNTINFAWGSPNRTSIVTGGAGSNQTLYPNNIVVNDSRDWTAKDGNNSLRFRYPGEPAQIGTGETLAEQRWSMPLANGRADFWVRFWIRVPTNYVNDLSNANSKFLAIWANDYGSIGTGAVWNMRPKSDTGSRLLVSYAQGGQTPSAGPSGEINIGDVFDVPADRGAWFQFVMNFKCASSNGANDGEIRTYFRRENNSTFTELTALTGLNTYLDGGLSGIRGGYLLGSHRGYAEDTEWLVDDFEISTSSLVDSITLPPADLVVEGFESYSTGNLSDPTTNTISFAWDAPNRTSIVTGGAGANETVYPTANVVHDSRDWSAYAGSNSLRFRYPAGETQAEQGFTFSSSNSVWFRYWVRVPTNYVHNSSSPSNCKFFALYCDGYSASGTGGTVIWEFWHSNNVETNGSQIAVHYAKGDGNVAGGHVQYQDFCGPSDSGRWMQVVMQCVNSTGANADGIIRLYRRWDGESSFSLLHELTDAIIPLANDGNGWRAGYLMGWANPTYAADTEWLIDNFEMSSGSLI